MLVLPDRIKKIVIFSGQGAPAVTAVNKITELCGCEIEIQVIEEINFTLERILKLFKLWIKRDGAIKIIDRILLRMIPSLGSQDKAPNKSYVPHLITKNINSKEVIDLVESLKPDLAVCLGTGILGKRIQKAAKNKIINIHPGLNPRYRGTGNFWACYENNLRDIGVTLHFVDSGIDTGPIIYRTRLNPHLHGIPFANLDTFALEEGATLLAKILKNRHLVQPHQEEALDSRYYSFPGLTAFVRAKKNYEASLSPSNKLLNK